MNFCRNQPISNKYTQQDSNLQHDNSNTYYNIHYTQYHNTTYLISRPYRCTTGGLLEIGLFLSNQIPFVLYGLLYRQLYTGYIIVARSITLT